MYQNNVDKRQGSRSRHKILTDSTFSNATNTHRKGLYVNYCIPIVARCHSSCRCNRLQQQASAIQDSPNERSTHSCACALRRGFLSHDRASALESRYARESEVNRWRDHISPACLSRCPPARWLPHSQRRVFHSP